MNKKKGGVDSSFATKIKGNLDEVENTVANILKSLRSFKIDESTSFDIKLCLQEALINAVEHGNRSNKDLPVIIDYSVSEGRLKISVEDSGGGFNHNNLPDPTAKENLLKTKGRGVYLIRHLMDNVYFNKKGNKITMIKHLGGQHANK